MKNMAKSLLLWLTVGALAGFWPFYFALGNAEMTEVSSGLMSGTCLAIIAQFSSEAFLSIKRGTRGSDFLIFGIFVATVATLVHRNAANTVRWTERAPWILDGPLIPYAIWAMAFAFSTLLIAKGTKGGIIPPENFGWFAFAMMSGLAIAAVSIMFF